MTMTRKLIGAAAAAVLSASCASPGSTYMGFSVGVEGAPPPPPPVMVEPGVEVVSGGVYVVSDPSVPYDMFRYGDTWWMYSDGYWYRGASYRGPFAAVDVRYVPREVVTVPPERWKHHPHGGPPGLARRRGWEH